jgi:hypothetical protein
LVSMQDVGAEKFRLQSSMAARPPAELSSSQILGSFKSPAPSAFKRLTNVVETARAKHKISPSAPPVADKSDKEMPEMGSSKDPLISWDLQNGASSGNEGPGQDANGSSDAVPPSPDKAGKESSLGGSVESHASGGDEAAVGGVKPVERGQDKAVAGPTMLKKEANDVNAEDEVGVSGKTLEARLIRMEDLMVTK